MTWKCFPHCEGNPPVIGGFLAQRDSNVELWCFLCFHRNKLLNKQLSCQWLEMPWKSCDTVMQSEEIRCETIHRISRYIVTQLSKYISWYRKIYQDIHHFCMIYFIIIRLLIRNLSISKNSIYYIIEIQIVSWDMYRDTLHIVHIISPQEEIYFVQLHHIIKLTHNSLKCKTSPSILSISSMSRRYGHECMTYNGQMGHVNRRPDKPCWSCRHPIISFKSVQECAPVDDINVNMQMTHYDLNEYQLIGPKWCYVSP